MEKDEIERDVDDIFKDFEYNVTGKKDAPKSPSPQITPKKLSGDEDFLEDKYRREQELLEEKYEKEKELLDKKRKEDLKRKKEVELRENILRQKSAPLKPANKSSVNVERIGYLAIIIVLVAYIAIDLSFYHGGKSAEAKKDQAVAPATITPNTTIEQSKSNESKEVKAEEKEEEKKEEPVVPAANEGTKLSGKIILKIDNIATEISEKLNDTGYINSVTFTIDNGKDKALTPIVDVYAYDSEMDKMWETKNRGQYKGAAISSGNQQTVTIDLLPKTFRNLDLKKDIRLTLNDTNGGFIVALTDKVLIS